MRSTRFILPTVLAVATLLAVAACSSPSALDDALPHPAATEVIVAPGTTTTITDELPTLTEDDLLGMLDSAAEALRGRSYRSEYTLGGSAADVAMGMIESEIDADGNFVARFTDTSSGSAAAETLEVRSVDDVTYLRLPEFAAADVEEWDSGEAWVILSDGSLGIIGAPCASLTGALVPEASSGCTLSTDMAAISASVSEAALIGIEEIEGVETTHVQFVLDLSDVLKGLGDEFIDEDAASGDALAFITEMFSGQLPVDVWFDAELLPRRMTIDFASLFAFDDENGTGMGTPEEMPTTVTFEFFDYDAVSMIEAPDHVVILGSYKDLLQGVIDLPTTPEPAAEQ